MKTVMREKQWAEKYPDLGTSPLPTEPYICEEHFARERDLVFRRTWINVGRVEEVPKAGDWFVREVAICKVWSWSSGARTAWCAAFTTCAPIAATSSCWTNAAPARLTQRGDGPITTQLPQARLGRVLRP